jgi:hypothetical protein
MRSMTVNVQRGEQPADDAYVPGRCNIGPAEIARRRMVGHIGLAGTIVGFVILALPPIHPLWRLLLFFPASVSASGYLQAALHFCAGFGSRGIFNFGQLGQGREIVDPEALARDRAMSNRVGVTSGLVGMVVAIVAVLLPV